MKTTLAVIELQNGAPTVVEANHISSEYSIYMIADDVQNIDLKQIRKQIKIKIHENKRLNPNGQRQADRQQAVFKSIPAAERPTRVDREYPSVSATPCLLHT